MASLPIRVPNGIRLGKIGYPVETQMRSWLELCAAACCLVAAGTVVYLHGFERALGHDDWQYRTALIAAYSREALFRAGPCVLAGLAAVLAARWGRGVGWVAAASLVVAVTCVAGTYLTVQRYIVATPGQMMPSLVWDEVSVLLWVVAVALVLTMVTAAVNGRLRRV